MRTQLKYSKTGEGEELEREKNTKQKNVTFKIIKPSDTTRKKSLMYLNGRNSKKSIERNCMKCTQQNNSHTHTEINNHVKQSECRCMSKPLCFVFFIISKVLLLFTPFPN